MSISSKKSSIHWLIILIMQVAIFTVGCDSNPFDNKPFDQKAWQANPFKPENSNSVRLYMSENLIEKHLKIGMTRQQTRKLLGEPDLQGSYCDQDFCDNYLLGEYVLSLSFDKAGKLTKSEIISV